MRRALLISAAALTAFGLISSASAESDRQRVANRKILHKFAECVVKKHRATAAEVILALDSNTMVEKKHSSLIDENCFVEVGGSGKSMAMGGDLFKYALADSLLRPDLKAVSLVDFTNRLPLAHAPAPDPAMVKEQEGKIKSKKKKADYLAGIDKYKAASWLSRYGECLVRGDTANAQLLLMTPIETPEELSRLRALSPIMSACLKEGTLKFNRITLRGTIAMNYFRLLNATPVAAAVKVN